MRDTRYATRLISRIPLFGWRPAFNGHGSLEETPGPFAV